jgi:aminopeptidase N
MQDTPSMKFTYDLEVTTERKYNTFATGNFSKITFNKNFQKVTNYEMRIPVPGYLLALAIGALKEKAVGTMGRSSVITEDV